MNFIRKNINIVSLYFVTLHHETFNKQKYGNEDYFS